jgi:hypothetical protein
MIKAVIVMKILLNRRGTIIHDGLDPPTHPETSFPDMVLFLHVEVTFIYPGQNQLRHNKKRTGLLLRQSFFRIVILTVTF